MLKKFIKIRYEPNFGKPILFVGSVAHSEILFSLILLKAFFDLSLDEETKQGITASTCLNRVTTYAFNIQRR